MFYFDKEKYYELSSEFTNVIRENKIHILPHLITNHAVVEIILTEENTVIIESQYQPIRYGRHCGTRVHLGSIYGIIDYNPKLIWNGKEWHLQTFGTFLFSELEINSQERK
jgi:hypothetical protein